MNEEILRQAGFSKEVERIKAKRCPFCNKEIVLTEFRNDISRKEYKISGLCQGCQDEIFGRD